VAQLAVVGMWASTFVLTKGVFAEVTPLAFTGARFLLIPALALAVLAARNGGRLPPVARADLPRFVAAGLTGYTGYQLGFVLGLDRTSPFASSLLIALVPLFTTAMLALRGEPTPRRAWVGLAIAVVGVAIFLADKRGSSADGGVVGDLLSLGAAVSFAAYGVLTRPLVLAYPRETYTAYTTLAGAVPLLLIAAPAMVAQPWATVTGRDWLAIVYLSIFPVYVAYQLWNWAISRRGAVAASAFALLVPVVGGVLSALIIDERFGPTKLLGAGLVLAGLAVLRLRRLG